MTNHSCQSPIDYERFLVYWFGELTPADEEALELQLVSCPDCGKLGETWSEQTQAIREGVTFVPRGFLTPEQVAALGDRAAVVEVGSSSPTEVTLRRDAIHVFRVALDADAVAGCERLDVEYFMAGHADPTFHVSDLPRDPRLGPIHLACSGHVLATHADVSLRVVGTRAGGQFTVLESVFHFV